MSSANEESIKLEHGSGGHLSRWLVEEVIYPVFKSEAYTHLGDSSRLSIQGIPFFTTDTYVVDPPFFPGGDIGKLAVFGTCNDLAVAGARPRYLSLGFILEEGFPLEHLRAVLSSIARAAEEAEVAIVTGDTKVVPRGKGGGIYINSSGIGEQEEVSGLTGERISPGDRVIITGPVGEHGIAVMAKREGLSVAEALTSDCAPLYPLLEPLFSLGQDLRFLRDATRGGVAAIVNEVVAGTGLGIEVSEDAVPIAEKVRSVAEILGLNPLEVANEGVAVCVVAPSAEERTLSLLREHSRGREAAVIGRVVTDHAGKVVLETTIGGKRILDFPRGLLLPRIC